jgi:predicted NBD/HSP70 family sugar kinase
MKVLVLDVGGTHVKIYRTGRLEPVKIASGPALTPRKLVKAVQEATDGWSYDVVAIGYPGPVVRSTGTSSRASGIQCAARSCSTRARRRQTPRRYSCRS